MLGSEHPDPKGKVGQRTDCLHCRSDSQIGASDVWMALVVIQGETEMPVQTDRRVRALYPSDASVGADAMLLLLLLQDEIC